MKIKDFFSKLKEQGKIENEDFDKFLGSVPDADMPDTVFESFENTFMTADRAINDKGVKSKVRAEMLNPIDDNIKQLYPLLDDYSRAELEAADSTYKKTQLLGRAFGTALEKAKKAAPNSEEDKKRISQLEENLRESTEKLKSANSEKDTWQKSIQENHKKEISELKLDYALKDRINSYNIAAEFEPLKNEVRELALNNVKKSGVLVLDEKGQIQVTNPENGGPLYKGNDVVTVDKLLDPIMEKYVKKSNSSGAQNTNSNGHQPPPPKAGEPRRGVPTGPTFI